MEVCPTPCPFGHVTALELSQVGLLNFEWGHEGSPMRSDPLDLGMKVKEGRLGQGINRKESRLGLETKKRRLQRKGINRSRTIPFFHKGQDWTYLFSTLYVNLESRQPFLSSEIKGTERPRVFHRDCCRVWRESKSIENWKETFRDGEKEPNVFARLRRSYYLIIRERQRPGMRLAEREELERAKEIAIGGPIQ